MSIEKKRDGVWLIRWREGGRNRSLQMYGSHELAKKVEHKKLAARDENRHLDVRREVNVLMTTLIKRYRNKYAAKKRSYDREKSVLAGIEAELGSLFVRDMDRLAVQRRYQCLAGKKNLRGRRRSALQCHAPHDGESLNDLVEGNRYRPEPR